MHIERLGEVKEAYKERKQLEGIIAMFENMRISPRGAVYGAERVQTSARGDIQPDNIAKIDELLECYNAKLTECLDLIAEFEDALERLLPRERMLMRYYYIHGQTLERICWHMNLSWTNMHRIKKSAIRKITQE